MSGFKIVRVNDNSKEQKARENMYFEQIREVIGKMPKELSFEEKVKYIFNYLVNEMDYDYECLDRNTGDGHVIPTVFNDNESVPEIYRNVGDTSQPISAFLHRKALCTAISKIANNFFHEAGIKSETVHGKTAVVDEEKGIRRGHVWNAVEDEDGRRSNVDITYGIFVRDNHEFEHSEGRRIDDFCMVSDEDLVKIGPHTIDEGTKPCEYTAARYGALDMKEVAMGERTEGLEEVAAAIKTDIQKEREPKTKREDASL